MTSNASQNNETGPAPPRGSPNRREFVKGAALAGATAAVLGAVGWMASGGKEDLEAQPPARRIVARKVNKVSLDPADASWRQAPALEVPLLAQNMTTPRVAVPTILSLSLRVLHDGNDIAFHLQWADDEVDDIEAMGRFRDSVAVELPVDPRQNANVMMGQPGRPVHILHWRASWQTEVDTGGRSLARAFPNAFSEVSPESIMGEEGARAHYPALYLNNPMASRKRTTPVEELVAEGFGTLTSHAEQRAQGRGSLADGLWTVVIAMPMAGGENKANLRPGDVTRVAVAAWDGAAGNRGARKQWSNWVALEVEV
ncbi:MAG TPA: ethylbenzene dehydrogenase-related protein [Dehalococcoidia bacterium]|nr:ethylbenzene dehydrogenase-related protein [Dehalococcoidia bacterium]